VSRNPLAEVGAQQAREAVVEVSLPLVAAGVAWYFVHQLTGDLQPSAPFTDPERLGLLGAAMALTGWAVARQLVLYGRREPRSAVAIALAVSVSTLFTVAAVLRGQQSEDCAALGGTLVAAAPMSPQPQLCQIGGVPDNIYLPGRLARPAWDGHLSPGEWVGLALAALLGAVALRDRRLLRTQIPQQVHDDLMLAPAAGAAGALGKPAVSGARVVACANLTLWGEICGQLYSADKAFVSGEWCLRCCQVFVPVDREVTLKVVTLFSADIDVLNGLERMDTISWPQGEPAPPDARLSGQERWVALGHLSLPDTLTIAQVLAFVHGELPAWGKDADPAREQALSLASTRASRVHAWIWTGAIAHRLTYARPTPRCILALGPTRLRDLALDASEELTLQLDIGLLPLELRMGFRRSFLDPNRPAVVQNTRQNLWIPVAPPQQAVDAAGLWVPRLEGDALRAWLSTEQVRAIDKPGATTPLPHRAVGDPQAGQRARGPMDFVRQPIADDNGEIEPIAWPGASIAQWKWMEAEQIELLRRECLVLTEGGTPR